MNWWFGSAGTGFLADPVGHYLWRSSFRTLVAMVLLAATTFVFVPDCHAALVDHLKFDETSGLTAVDSSGNGNTGTLNNMTGSEWTAGTLCGALEFNGSDDYVEVAHSAELNGDSALTYAAWTYPDDWSGTQVVMAKSVHGGGSGRAQMGIFSESGLLYGRAETIGGRENVSATLPPNATWSHVALVFTGTSLILYVDGLEVASQSFSSTTLNQTTDVLSIGKKVGENEHYFDGLIDDVRVYDQALTPAEISAVAAETCDAHFSISHDGSATTSVVENITIAHHDVDHVTDTSYTGTITLSTSTSNGDWSLVTGSGTLTNFGSGSATYTYVGADNGSVVLGLLNTNAEILNINVTDGTDSEDSGEDASLTFINPGSTNWGRDIKNPSATTPNHSRAMAGTSPNTDDMQITEIGIYLGAQTGDVRLAVYTGGALDNPTSATLLWDAGTVNPMGTEGWYTISHPSGGVSWAKNTVTWLAWKRNNGVAVYYSTSSADSGDFQTFRGRNQNSFSQSPSTAFPSSYGETGDFTNFWYSIYVAHEVVAGPMPDLVVQNISLTSFDPSNGTTNPKSIPGAFVKYTITVTNEGLGPVDVDTMVVTEPVPVNTNLFVGDLDAPSSGPVLFVDGSTASGLTYTFVSLSSTTDDVEFSDDGGATYAYTPAPDVDGFDPAVTHLRILLKGSFAASDGVSHPSFSLELQVRID